MEVDDSEFPKIPHAQVQNNVLSAYHCCQSNMCNNQGYGATPTAMTAQDKLSACMQKSMSQVKEVEPVTATAAAAAVVVSSTTPAPADHAVNYTAAVFDVTKHEVDNTSSADNTTVAFPAAVVPLSAADVTDNVTQPDSSVITGNVTHSGSAKHDAAQNSGDVHAATAGNSTHSSEHNGTSVITKVDHHSAVNGTDATQSNATVTTTAVDAGTFHGPTKNHHEPETIAPVADTNMTTFARPNISTADTGGAVHGTVHGDHQGA